MRVLDVLRDMGLTARMTGETEPTDAQEYLARIQPFDGELPPWEAVKARHAELTRPTINDVRTEAGRRIVARFPIHAQINMLARSSELLLIGTANWSAEQRTEAEALQEARDWIKAVRDASNTLERAPPDDYAADRHWPAQPA